MERKINTATRVRDLRNYGPSIMLSKQAERRGYSQVLWLVDGKVSEVGTSNIFFFWKNNGEDELVTPALDGTILPGIVRDSILVPFLHKPLLMWV